MDTTEPLGSEVPGVLRVCDEEFVPWRAPRRTRAERERDLVVIAERYCRGETQAAIAEHIGISQQAISRDIRTITERWKAEASREIEAHLARELAALDDLEGTYRAGWERSCTDGRDGSPAFLRGIASCIDRRCKLLGLDGATKVRVSLADERERVRADAEARGIDPALAVDHWARILKDTGVG